MGREGGEMNINESIRQKAVNLVVAEKKLRQVIDEASSRGELIPRFGDLPEFKPYADAKNAWIEVAKDVIEE